METQNYKESRLGTLIAILIFVSGLFYGLVSFLFKITNESIVVEGVEGGYLIIFIVVSSFYIIKYFLSIIKTLYYDTLYESRKRFKEFNENKLLKIRNDTYQNLISSWNYPLFMIFATFLMLLYYVSLGNLGIILAIFLSFIFYIYFLIRFQYPFFKKIDFNKFIQEKFNKEKSFSKILSSIAKEIFLFVLYFIVLVQFTTSFYIDMDKDHYFDDENVMLTIKPQGAIPPQILSIHYSNDGISLFNGTDKEFSRAPRYIIINANDTTTEPQNSYVYIAYKYFKDVPLLKIYSGRKIVGIPVFNKEFSKENNENKNISIRVNVEQINKSNHSIFNSSATSSSI